MRREPGPLARVALLVLCLLLGPVLGLAGCSGDDEAEPGPEQPSGSTSTAPGLETRVEVGEVVGRLPKGPARTTAAAVAEVVDRWLDAAYVAGDYPRSDFGAAYPGFTRGAARLAAQQPGLTSNARLAEDLDGVVATRRVVRVDVLAPKGEPAGATAHVNLVMDLSGDVERTDQVRGRVVLTRVKGRWQVFGFDIERGEVG